MVPLLGLSKDILDQGGFLNYIIGFFVAVSVHEFTHLTLLKLLELDFRVLVLLPFGGIWSPPDQKSTKSKLLLFYLLPPLINLASAGYIWWRHADLILSGGAAGLLSFHLFWWHLLIGALNLLPIFPLDLGQFIFQELRRSNPRLLMRIKLGETVSLVGAIVSLLLNAPMFFLLFLLLLSVSANLSLTLRGEEYGASLKVSEVMCPGDRIDTLPHGSRVGSAFTVAEKSVQEHFPVLHNNDLMGVVSRTSLLKAFSRQEKHEYLNELPNSNYFETTPQTTVKELMVHLPFECSDPVIVLDKQRFVGLLYPNKLLSTLLARSLDQEQEEE